MCNLLIDSQNNIGQLGRVRQNRRGRGREETEVNSHHIPLQMDLLQSIHLAMKKSVLHSKRDRFNNCHRSFIIISQINSMKMHDREKQVCVCQRKTGIETDLA